MKPPVETQQKQTTVWMPFIDMLYALGIGIGFARFPLFPKALADHGAPEQAAVAFLAFLLTLIIAIQDWHDFHEWHDGKALHVGEATLQVLCILTISVMFAYAGFFTLRGWLVAGATLFLLDTFWNGTSWHGDWNGWRPRFDRAHKREARQAFVVTVIFALTAAFFPQLSALAGESWAGGIVIGVAIITFSVYLISD